MTFLHPCLEPVLRESREWARLVELLQLRLEVEEAPGVRLELLTEIAPAAWSRTCWRVVATEDFVYDQRLIDPRLAVPSLARRLSALV